MNRACLVQAAFERLVTTMASIRKTTPQKASRNQKTTAKRPRTRLKINTSNGHNGHHAATITNGHAAVPLRTQTAQALQIYFSHLDGDHPRRLYNMVMREVEEPLFRAVLEYVKGNQSRAAEVLGLNRGTLRKKLREHGLAEAE